MTDTTAPSAAPLIVGLGGTTREGSSSERAVRAVLAHCQALGVRTRMFDGEALAALPHYAPERTERSPGQRDFIETMRKADGVVVGTPGYHGGMSGLVKNALDLLEDLRGDPRPYLEGRAAGLIVTAAGWQAGGVVLSALRDVVHALRGWPTPLGVSLNSAGAALFNADGGVADPAAAASLSALAAQVVGFAERRRG